MNTELIFTLIKYQNSEIALSSVKPKILKILAQYSEVQLNKVSNRSLGEVFK